MSGTLRTIATGAGWLYAYRWIERLLDFASVVVLARLLSPDDFGLVAIAASIVTIVDGLGALGIDKALIRNRADDRPTYDSAWTLSVLRGFLSALAMVAIAQFLPDARIAAVLRALALGPILTGCASPRFIVFERDLVYSRLAMLTLGARLLAVVVTLSAAIAGRGYWSLVLGQLTNALAAAVLTYVLSPYRPRVSFARFGSILAFSGPLTLTSAVTMLSMETDRLIVGRLLGVSATGLYDMTQRVGVLPTRELLSPLQRILFPAYTRMATDVPRLRRVVCESINVLGSLSLPAGFGFALVAGDFVPLVLGRQWTPIVPLLIVLVPFLGVRSTLSMALPSMLALGLTWMLFRVSAGYALVHVPAFILGTALFGLPGAIWSIVAAGVLYSYLNAWMLRRTLGITLGEILTELRRPFAATAMMSLAVGMLVAATPLEMVPESGSWGSLAVKAIAGAVVFCGTQYVIWRIEGRPAGIERRLAQLMMRPAPATGVSRR
jgi:PST family polysaccharide transporter